MSRSLPLSLFICCLFGCAPAPLHGGAACPATASSFLKETLVFGRNKPGGGIVTSEEWQAFLNDTITPRFPEGLTVQDAHGQWRGGSGQVEREESQVVTIFHSGDEEKRLAIQSIARAYKERFRQEAVLHETTPTCATFE